MDHNTNPEDHVPDVVDAVCLGCNLMIEGGSAVRLGDGVWHLECFRCAKCGSHIETESNSLMLSDNEPICANCSYNCRACGEAITDEAIVTGKDTYHAHCFKCVKCDKRIQDLTYANTSKGIVCLACHRARKKHGRPKVSRDNSTSSQPASTDPSAPSASGELPRRTTPQPNTAPTESHSLLQPHASPPNSINGKITQSRSLGDLKTSSNNNNNSASISMTPGTNQLKPLPKTSSETINSISSDTKKDKKINGHTIKDLPSNATAYKNDNSTASTYPRAYVEELVQELQTLKRRLAESDGSFDRIRAINDKAIEQLNATKSELAIENTRRRELESEVMHWKMEYTKLTEVHRQLVALKGAETDSSKDTSTDAAKAHEEKIAHANAQLAVLQQAITQLLKERANGEEAIRNLQSKCSEMRSTVDELTKQRDNLTAEIEELGHLRQEAALDYGADTGSITLSPTNESSHSSPGLPPVASARSFSAQNSSYSTSPNSPLPPYSSSRSAGDGGLVIPPHSSGATSNKLSSGKSVGSSMSGGASRPPPRGASLDTPSGWTPTINIGKDMPSLPSNNDFDKNRALASPTHMRKGSAPIPAYNTAMGPLPVLPPRSSNSSALPENSDKQTGKSTDMGKKFKWARTAFKIQKAQPINYSVTTTNNGGSSNSGNGIAGPVPLSKVNVTSSGTGHHHHHSNSISGSNINGHNTTNNGSGNLNVNTTQNNSADTDSASIKSFDEPRSKTGSQPHSFVQHKYLRPIKCDHCAENLWGVQEVRCQVCGYHAHSKCAAFAARTCPGAIEEEASNPFALPKVAMIGNDLQRQLDLEDRTVPLLVERCIEAVEARGMDLEGIYRKTGPNSQLRGIMVYLSKGEIPNLIDNDEFNDIASITSVLKLYLRELPDPLLTYELYPKFIDVMDLTSEDERIKVMTSIIGQLPNGNKKTLKALCEHLVRVEAKSDVNLMTFKNLAVVFGPTLMRSTDPDREFLDMGSKNAVVEFIIKHSARLFLNNISKPPSHESFLGDVAV